MQYTHYLYIVFITGIEGNFLLSLCQKKQWVLTEKLLIILRVMLNQINRYNEQSNYQKGKCTISLQCLRVLTLYFQSQYYYEYYGFNCDYLRLQGTTFKCDCLKVKVPVIDNGTVTTMYI